MFYKALVIVKKNLFILGIYLIPLACNEEIKPLTFEIETISETFDSNIEVAFDKAKGNSLAASSVNTILQQEIIKVIPNSENYSSLDDALHGFDNQFKTFTADFEEQDLPWELAIETEITYQSNEVITIALSSYSDTGGAHGNDTIQLLNFNPNTGTLYSHSDIIDDLSEFKELAKSYFIKNLESDNLDISEFFFGEPFKLPENIGFSDGGLIMLYNVYEIASYSQGYTEFVIPYNDLDPFLNIN